MTEYKAGDIAMVTAFNRPEPYRAYWSGTEWREYGNPAFCLDTAETHRPLVVIDPEDDDDIERFSVAFSAQRLAQNPSRGNVRAAFQSLAAGPKPAEPQGLGAVVEDGQGRRYVRGPMAAGDLHWNYINDDHMPTCAKWRAVPAVRVLSEGVVQ